MATSGEISDLFEFKAQLRIEALNQARTYGLSAEDTVKVANQFFDFIFNGIKETV